ncbi:MAG: hypothetical protein M1823_001453 [Watsoniomyces obsoletus]|nr:MAG: hypothetical protein M1823_001453 [Watsoniomyces obsoletus]
MDNSRNQHLAPVRRACDACHRRKVKCDGRKPCQNCRHSTLICTFNAIPQKKGPKGHRARVISELRQRQQQQQQQHAHLELAVHDVLDGTSSSMPIRPTSWAPTPGRLTQELMDACIDFFFNNMYPTMPILDRGKLQRQTQEIHQSQETYCLLASLCAFMMIQPGLKLAKSNAGSPVNSSSPHETPPTTSGEDQDDNAPGRAMVEEVIRVRKGYDHVESPSVAAVMTSFFLFGSLFCLDRHSTAWYYLREATTLVHMLGMSDEASYHVGEEMECIRRRRLFWLLFVTERAYALQRHHPLTLTDSIAMPTTDEAPSERLEISGFIYLVNLFRPFDEVFVGLWNKSRADCSTEWLAQLQRQLTNALPAVLESTESQAADLRVSQQWLRSMVWQLSTVNGYLSMSCPESSMTFKYPIEIARDLVCMTSQMTHRSMEVHGVGLIWKIFDVACTLTDVMSCVPVETTTSSLEWGPRDYLNEFLTLISTLRGGQAKYVPPLLEKVETMLSTVSGPIIPPLIYETGIGDGGLLDHGRVDDQEHELEMGREQGLEGWDSSLSSGGSGSGYISTSTGGSSSNDGGTTFRTPPTLSTFDSDMSDFSLLSATEAATMPQPHGVMVPELYGDVGFQGGGGVSI